MLTHFKFMENVHLAEAKAMQKDIPVAANLQLRGTMCLSILMEQAIVLLKDKTFKEVKEIVLAMGTTLIRQGYVTNNFNVLLDDQLTQYRLQTQDVRTKIKTSFCKNQTTCSALKTFSNPELSQNALSIKAGTETLDTNSILDAAAEIYLRDAMDVINTQFELSNELVYTLKS